MTKVQAHVVALPPEVDEVTITVTVPREFVKAVRHGSSLTLEVQDVVGQ